VDTLPSDWASIRNRWEVYHAARTFVSLAAFGSALAAVLWNAFSVSVDGFGAGADQSRNQPLGRGGEQLDQ